MSKEEKQEQQQAAENQQYECKECGKNYPMSEARKREMACCGQTLSPTEVATKSTPTPFGP